MNLFDDEKNNTLDIPDFVEDKDDTDSQDVDMSIFNMSDEELYDDVPKKQEKQDKPKTKKKSNSTIVLCIVLICILLVTSIVATIIAFKEHNAFSKLEEELTQVKATITDYQTKINEKDNQIALLNTELESLKNSNTTSDPDNKYPSGTKLYITEDGHMQGVRETASVSADTAKNSDGTSYVLYWGDSVTLTGDATKDSDGNYWGQIDGGFIRIEYDGEIWASTEEQ